MLALRSFALVIMAAPFRSKSQLEAENAALRHQLIVHSSTSWRNVTLWET
jgi:hypothetical protein